MKKYAILLAAILIQLCLGGIYAWSSLVPWLTNDLGLTVTETQFIFGLTIAIFTISMTFAGRMQSRYGPRLVGTISGILCGAGYLLAAYFRGRYLGLLLGISLVSGTGIGFGYICPLATSIKWFPQHKGLVTGLAVAGFGGGGVMLSSLATVYLERGTDVLTLFRAIGIIYGLLIIGSSQMLTLPPASGGKKPNSRPSQQLSEILRQPLFWIMATGMFSGTFAGLLIIGNLGSIGVSLGTSLAQAGMAVSVFAVGNAMGRISWGIVYDRWGYPALSWCLFLLCGAILLLIPSSNLGALFIFAAWLVGFGFGGCFVLFAAHVGTSYGAVEIASIYPFIFLFYGLAGIMGPPVGGWLFEITGNYYVSVIVAAVVAFLGSIILRTKHLTITA